MFCQKCGAELQDDVRFCPNCGAEIATSINAEKRTSHASLLIRILILLTLVCLFASLFLTIFVPHCELYYTGYDIFSDKKISIDWYDYQYEDWGTYGSAYLISAPIVLIAGLLSLYVLFFPLFTKKAWSVSYLIPTIAVTALSAVCFTIKGISLWTLVGKTIDNARLDYFHMTASGYAFYIVTFCTLLFAIITIVYLANRKKKGVLDIPDSSEPFRNFKHKPLFFANIVLLLVSMVLWLSGGMYGLRGLNFFASELLYYVRMLLVPIFYPISILVLFSPFLAKKKFLFKYCIPAVISIALSLFLSVSGFIFICTHLPVLGYENDYEFFFESRTLSLILFIISSAATLITTFIMKSKIKKSRTTNENETYDVAKENAL